MGLYKHPPRKCKCKQVLQCPCRTCRQTSLREKEMRWERVTWATIKCPKCDLTAQEDIWDDVNDRETKTTWADYDL